MEIYYNEFDKKKAAMLEQLMKDGLIPKGDIDTRSIKEVKAHEIRHYTQCHFFAGIGLWTVALDLAGWNTDRPVWTGSCPCQPFSSAGQQKGAGEDRHLWPDWYNLIRECRPSTIFGEQVASAIAFGWLDAIYDDLEKESYAIAAAVLPACSVGAPHKRDRLWFVAQPACGDDRGSAGEFSKSYEREASKGSRSSCNPESGRAGIMGDSEYYGWNTTEEPGSERQAIFNNTQRSDSTCEFEGAGAAIDVADSESIGWPIQQPSHIGEVGREINALTDDSASGDGKACFMANPQEAERERRLQTWPRWGGASGLNCPDGKQRPVEPGISLLVDGYPHRIPILLQSAMESYPKSPRSSLKRISKRKGAN